MTVYTANEARLQFSELLNLVAYGKEQALITRSGKPLAAVISFAQFQVFQEWLINQANQQDTHVEQMEALPPTDDSIGQPLE